MSTTESLDPWPELPREIKALTLWQPWASAMCAGLKTVETRSWSTTHRGPLAIHASARTVTAADMGLVRALGRALRLDVARSNPKALADALPRGAVLGVVELVDVVPMHQVSKLADVMTAQEMSWGDWKPDRFAWICRPLVWFTAPFPAKGAQQLWTWTRPIAPS